MSAAIRTALWTLVVSFSLAPPARAEPPVPTRVLVVLGDREGTEVDPGLKDLPALSKPPFDSFTRKKLLAKSELKLEGESPGEVDLPNGRRLRIKLLGRSKEGGYRVQVSINRPGKKDYLPVMTVVAAPGDPFFVAGQKHQGGTLIIGIRVGTAGK